MAYNAEPNLRFLPYRFGDFRVNRPIQQGGNITTPWVKGIQDLCYNQLTLWAVTAPVIIQDSRRGATNMLLAAAAPTWYDFCLYRYEIPGMPSTAASTGRRYLTVTVTAQIPAGFKWQFRARTSSAITQTAAQSTAGGTEETISVDVECPQSGADYLILSVSADAAGKNVTITQVTARLKPMSTNVLGEGTAIFGTYFDPVDSGLQGTEGYPLTVAMTQALMEANMNFFQKNVRTVISVCPWEAYGTLPAAGKSLGLVTNTAAFQFIGGSTTVSRGSQWVYFPRPGVTKLKFFFDGYVAAWLAGADATMTFGFDGHAPVSFTVAKASALSAVTGWPTDSITNTVDVPAGDGPFFLNLVRTDLGTKSLVLMSFTVQEVIR